jgi:hypothetical protein
MLINIVLGLAILVVVLVVIIAARPSDFRCARSGAISASREVVFEQVNDLHKWEAWSPWAKLDPKAKSTYTGPAAGVGAAFSWSGNNRVGEGKMTITESRSGELVRFRLEFLRPMKATNIAEFTFQSDRGQTNVTWTMTGKNNFVGKAFGLVVNCDKMIGGQFEKGLADMKIAAEAAARARV